jgi:hypothetical protein
MMQRVTNRRRLLAGIVAFVLALAIVATPTGRAVALVSLVHVAEVSAKILRLPCLLLDHSKCFTLDRFDPTCPQCL